MSDPDEMVRDDAPVTSSKIARPDAALSAESVTISRSADELFSFWRNVANLGHFMENIERVEPIDHRRSRWTVKAPAGQTVSWESVITHEEPGRSISWQSGEGADVDNSGRVEFIDAGERGTVVRATIAYQPPAGAVGKLVAKVMQREPRIQSRRDLRRFKQLMETGEIATGARNHRLLSEQEEDR
jgi:uncharacterized membrane protein